MNRYNKPPSNGLINTIFGLGAAWIGFWILIAIGWVINLVQILTHLSGGFTTTLIVRLVGLVVAPLGGLMGLFVW